MLNRGTTARESFGHIAPALAEYTDDVLFGSVWGAFYSGWPTANTAIGIAQRAFDEVGQK